MINVTFIVNAASLHIHLLSLSLSHSLSLAFHIYEYEFLHSPVVFFSYPTWQSHNYLSLWTAVFLPASVLPPQHHILNILCLSVSVSHHTHTHTVLRLWVQLMNRGASAQLLVTALLHLDNSIANLVVLCVLVPVTRGVGGPGRKTLGEVWKRQICCFLVVRWLREDNVEKFPINIIWKWYSVIDYFDLISCCHFFIISYSILSLICYHIVLYNITIYSVLYTEYIIL